MHNLEQTGTLNENIYIMYYDILLFQFWTTLSLHRRLSYELVYTCTGQIKNYCRLSLLIYF